MTTAPTLSGTIGRWLSLPVSVAVGLAALFGTAHGGHVAIELPMLAVAGGYGLFGTITDVRVRRLLMTFPMVWLVCLAALYLVSVTASVTPRDSLASALSIACVISMTATAAIQIGIQTILKTLFLAMGLFLSISWFLFLVVPSVGVFQEPIAGGSIARMGGLTHPNSLGQIAGYAVITGLLLCRIDGRRPGLRWIIFALALGALVASMSRTSAVAVLVAIPAIYRDRLGDRRLWTIGLMLATSIAIGLVVASLTSDLGHTLASKVGLVAKSGDVGELTSLTGRTEIWAYAIELVAQRPWTGYGATTAKYHFAEHSFHAHNLVLNIAFTTGILGGLIALAMYLGRVAAVLFRPHRIADGLLVFMLFDGLVEPVIFANLAGLPTILWTLALAMPLLVDDPVNLPANGIESNEVAR